MTSRLCRAVCGVLLTCLGLVLAFLGGGPAAAAGAPVPLGTASFFAVVGATTVTNTGPTVVTGNLGVSPGTAVTGFPPGLVQNGTIHSADALAADAQADMTTAFNDAAGRASTAAVLSDLAGQTLLPGVYDGGTLSLTGALTLDAQGDAGAVFLLRAGSTLITGSASSVVLTPGTNPCGVFWLVGSSATLGTGSHLVGTVLAQTAISVGTGTDVTGRLLARTAAVTLDTNAVTLPVCTAAATPSPTVAATATTSPSPTASPTASPMATGSASPTASAAASATATAAPTSSASGSPRPSATTAPGGTGGESSTGSGAGTTTRGDGGAGQGRTPVVPEGAAGGEVAGTTAGSPALPHTGAPLAETLMLGVVLVGVGCVLCLSSVRPVRRPSKR